jgi:hypothetical protein
LYTNHFDSNDYLAVQRVKQDPQSYLDRVAKIAAGKIDTAPWWGGGDPREIGWEILFQYIQSHHREIMDGPKLDSYLDALETSDLADSRENLRIRLSDHVWFSAVDTEIMPV